MSGDPEVVANPDLLGDRIRTDVLMEWIAWFKLDADRRRADRLEAGAKQRMEAVKRQAPQHLDGRR